jgi:hypothetical protein
MTFEQRNHALSVEYIKGESIKPKSLFEKVMNKIDDVGWSKDWTRALPFSWRMRYYDKIRPIWNDEQKRIRKSIPRTWCDVSHLMVNVNFEMIKKFYEEEYKAGIVDWEASGPGHVEFTQWLEWAYNYITMERPAYEKAQEDAYPPFRPIEEIFGPAKTDEKGRTYYEHIPQKQSYEELYGEVNRLEKLIEDTDTKVLTEFVQHRGYFWT